MAEEKKINLLKPITDLLSGNFFGKEFIQKNIGFMVYLTFLVMLYIGYGYYADKQMKRVAELENMEELNSRDNSATKELNQISLQSNVLKMVKEKGLEELKQAPIIIKEESENE
ncbi:MAG: FtsL-like putative cell division protein [Flavobacteriales bacterium]